MSEPTDNRSKENGSAIAQLAYASFIEKGMFVVSLLLFLTFTLYILGVIPPYLSVEQLTQDWRLNLQAYLERTGVDTGWSWLSYLSYSDFLDYLGIFLLASLTLPSYLLLGIRFLRQKDRAYALLVLLEVIILLLAISGVLTQT